MKLFKKILKVILGVVLLLAAAAAYLWFFEQPSHSQPVEAPKPIAASGNDILDGIRRGAEYLRVHQETDGNFSRGLLDPKPAFTAMAVDALARCPDKFSDRKQNFMQKAVDAILARQQPDGSICTPALGIPTYTTSVSVMALTALENPAYAAAVERAKKYLLSVQNAIPESLNEGGAGYSANGRVSGDVTAMWVEALKDAGVKEGDQAFKNAEKFFQHLQNNSETNTKPAPGTAVGDDGGFFYRPGESPAGSDTGKDGKKIPRSYGLMSYAGLKSFLYMKISKDDPRVQSAVRWVKNHYTLEENCGLEKGKDGLFYYYLTMAKALSAYGAPTIETPTGRINWAQDMSAKVLALQSRDGCWRNEQSSRWMENDAVLVTTYAIHVLSLCYEELEKQKIRVTLIAKACQGKKPMRRAFILICALLLILPVSLPAGEDALVLFDGNTKTKGSGHAHPDPSTISLSTADPFEGQKNHLEYDAQISQWWGDCIWCWSNYDGKGVDVSAYNTFKLTMKLAAGTFKDLKIRLNDEKGGKSEEVAIIASGCAQTLSDKYTAYEIPMEKFGAKFDKTCVGLMAVITEPSQKADSCKLYIARIEFTISTASTTPASAPPQAPELIFSQDFGKVDLKALPPGWSITSSKDILITDDPSGGKVLAIKHREGNDISALDITLDAAKVRGHTVHFGARIKFPGSCEAVADLADARPRIAIFIKDKSGDKRIAQQSPEPEKPDWQNVELTCPIDKGVEGVFASVRIPEMVTEIFVQCLTLELNDGGKPGPTKSVTTAPAKPDIPSSTLDEGGLVFNPAIVATLKHATAKSKAVKTSIAFIGPGLPQKGLEIKVAEGWTLIEDKQFSGPSVKPRNLLVSLPDFLVEKKPEIVMFFCDASANRKTSSTERYDWEDLARLCMRLGAVPVIAVPPGQADNLEKDPHAFMLQAATDAGCPALDLKIPAQVSRNIARLGSYVEKYVFGREPPAVTQPQQTSREVSE